MFVILLQQLQKQQKRKTNEMRKLSVTCLCNTTGEIEWMWHIHMHLYNTRYRLSWLCRKLHPTNIDYDKWRNLNKSEKQILVHCTYAHAYTHTPNADKNGKNNRSNDSIRNHMSYIRWLYNVPFWNRQGRRRWTEAKKNEWTKPGDSRWLLM